jgi:hypothetical protein
MAALVSGTRCIALERRLMLSRQKKRKSGMPARSSSAGTTRADRLVKRPGAPRRHGDNGVGQGPQGVHPRLGGGVHTRAACKV